MKKIYFLALAALLPAFAMAADYVTPNGSTSGSGKGQDYLETVTSSGAKTDVVISRSGTTGLHEVCNGENETIVVTPGTNFSIHFQAKRHNNTAATVPSPEDLRFTKAFIFADWNADGEFELVGTAGKGCLETGFGTNSEGAASHIAGNFAEVLDFSQDFSVPADAPYGETRIRVIFTSAWTAINPDGTKGDRNDGKITTVEEGAVIPGDFQYINGGRSYDYIVNITKPTYAVTFAGNEFGSLSVTLDDTNLTSGNEVEEGSVLYLSSTPEEGYELDHYTVNDEAIEGNTVTVNGEMTLGAVFTLKSFEVTFAGNENGSLTVKAGETALESGAKVEYGTELTLSAEPAEGYELSAFTVGGVAIEGNTITVKDALNLGVTFAKKSITLTIPTFDNGSITVKAGENNLESGASVEYGSELTLSAEPAEGYELAYFTVNGERIEGNTIVYKEGMTFGAVFTLKSFEVTFAGNENGSLTVKAGETALESGAKVEYGTELTLSAEPVEGYELDHFTNGGEAIEGNTITVKDALDLGVVFALKSFEVTFADDEHGTMTVMNGENAIESGAKVEYGTVLTLSATAAEGYKLDHFTVGDEAIEGNTVTVKEALNLRVVFALESYEVTFTNDEHGTMTVMNGENAIESGAKVDYGTVLTLSATAAEGYELAAFTVDGVAIEGNTVTVKGEMALGVTFAKKSITLTIPTYENGSLTVKAGETTLENGATVEYGTEITLEATPAEGYDFAYFTVNGEAIEGNTVSYKEGMTFGAVFTLKSFAITLADVENGTLTVKNGETAIESGFKVDYGTVLTLEATPADEYEFESFTVNGEAIEGNTVTVKNEMTLGATFTFVGKPYFDNYAHVTGTVGTQYSARGVKTLLVEDNAGNSVTVQGTGQTSHDVYADRTETAILTVNPGAIITVTGTPEAENGNIWTHSYLYIDFGQDGRFDVDMDNLDANNDLVVHNGYSLTSNNKYGSNADTADPTQGSSMLDGTKFAVTNTDTYSLHAFQLPEDMQPGTYRVRFKNDWNSTHPYGRTNNTLHSIQKTGNGIIEAGGVILDFTLVVVEDPSYDFTFNTEGEGTLKVFTDAAMTNEVATGSSLKASQLTDGLYFAVTPAEDYEFKSLTVNSEDVTTEVVDGVYHMTTVEADVTATATFAEIPVVEYFTYLHGENGLVEIYTDAELTNLLLADNSEDGILETITSKECKDGIYIVVYPSDNLELKALEINGVDFTEQLIDNVLHITDLELVPNLEDMGMIAIGATYEMISNYVLWLNGVNGPVEVYSDAELTNQLLADNNSEEGTETTISSKDCKDGLYIVLHTSDELKLVTLRINGSVYTSQVDGNIYHIEDVTTLPSVDERGIEIGVTYEVTGLAALMEIGIDVNSGDTEIYNMQGVRIPTENVTNGYYIIRQGNKTVKVLIKK